MTEDLERRYRIEKILPGGYGLCRDDDGVILVDLAAPGDLVELGEIRRRKGVRRGSIIRIIEPGPGRVEPPCGLYGVCGGCDLQHLSYETQLEAKTEILKDSLIRQGGFSPDDPLLHDLAVVGCPSWESRNRFQFHMTGEGPALMRRGSRQTVRVESCPVADPAIGPFLNSGWRDLPRRMTRPGERMPLFAAGGKLHAGEGELELVVAGKTLRFDVRGFFQSNLAALESMAKYIIALLPTVEGVGRSALDIYCGVGLFGALLPPSYGTVHAVEINSRSLDYARENIGPRGRFFAGPVDRWVARQNGQTLGNLDLGIVDPPRTGLDKSLRLFLTKLRVPTLIYVSCDPVTLSRDLAELRSSYRVLSIRGFDLSPQTHHLETVVKLEAIGE
jgi:23S rRNA (uracil1939-C5)-methyltransferase